MGTCWSENADSLKPPWEKGQLQQTRCLYIKKVWEKTESDEMPHLMLSKQTPSDLGA